MQPSQTGSTSNLHQQPIQPETPSQKNIFTKVYDAIAFKINAVVGKTFNKGETPPQGGLSNFILNSLWGSSKLVTTKEMVTRSRIPDSEMTVSNKNIHHTGTQMRVVDEYKKYDVSPPYPTKKITLNEAQSKILDELCSDDEIKGELQAGLPYNKLSKDAKAVYQTVNLDLVQKHLQNICTIANENRENPEFTKLNALGINHYEIEIKDTLARGLTFIDKNLLNEIEIPSKQLDGTFKMVNYKIERFNLSGETKMKDLHREGHPLFFLIPKIPGEAPPLVIARGTLLQDDSLDGAQASIKADGRKDASLKMIANNRELETKLNDIYRNYGRFEVAGHSLGGNIALNLAVAFPQHIDRVVTISAPQISSAVYKAWTKIPPEERPKVDNLFVEWDAIPCCGRKIIGSAILVEELDDKNKPVKLSNPIERHLKGLFNHKVSYAEIDKSREMKKNTRAFVSFMTKIAGKLISGPTSQTVNEDNDTDEDELLNQTDKMDRKAALAWLQEKRIPDDLEFEIQSRDVIAASPIQIKETYPLFENFNSYLKENRIKVTPELTRKAHLAYPGEMNSLFRDLKANEQENISTNIAANQPLKTALAKRPGALSLLAKKETRYGDPNIQYMELNTRQQDPFVQSNAEKLKDLLVSDEYQKLMPSITANLVNRQLLLDQQLTTRIPDYSKDGKVEKNDLHDVLAYYLNGEEFQSYFNTVNQDLLYSTSSSKDKIGMAKSFYADDFISWFSTAIDSGHISVENLDPIHLKISAALNKQFEKLDLDIAGAQISSNYTRIPISLDLPPNKDSNTIPLSGIKRTADAQKLEKRLLSENPLKIISRINTKYPTSLEKQDAWESKDFDSRFYCYISKHQPEILLGNPEKSLVSAAYKDFVKVLTGAYQKGFVSLDLNHPFKSIRGVKLEEYTNDKDIDRANARKYEASQIRTVLSGSFEKIQQNWDASANINNDFYIGLTLYIKNMSNNPPLTQQGAMLSQNDKVSIAIGTYVNDLANFHEKGLVHVINPKNPIESNIIRIQQAVPNKLGKND